ncbi:lipopolysaccharide assembly protein LapA domain-containing protein [Azospirillum sp. ST 5-10]|uniref:lipopolysaccharide assembly protein LapA domain-containing protein n=1 Tax=unclassified Azospirillum TaxID=2630922 RepID=UPI003F49BFBF
MRYLTWIVTIPIAVVAVLFAVSNRETVVFTLWPTPFSLEAPLYLATLVALVVGFLAGGFIAWVAQGGNRRRARVQTDRVHYLERDLRESQARLAAAEKRIAEMTPPVSGQPRSAATLPAPAPAPAPTAPTPPTVH